MMHSKKRYNNNSSSSSNKDTKNTVDKETETIDKRKKYEAMVEFADSDRDRVRQGESERESEKKPFQFIYIQHFSSIRSLLTVLVIRFFFRFSSLISLALRMQRALRTCCR